MTRTSLIATAAAALMLGSAVATAAENSFTGNVTLATDYVFRGISQTNERAAIQGGFDAVLSNGIYAGIWASNVNFGTGISGTSTEVDYYGGYSGALPCDGCSFKVGGIYYRYEGDKNLDYVEGAFSVTWNTLTVGVNYSPSYLGDYGKLATGDDVGFWYPYINYSYTLPGDFTLSLHGALNEMSEKGLFEAGQDDYGEWSVGLGKAFGGFNFALTYWDTNTHNLPGPLDADGGARVVFSVNKAL